MPLRKPRFELLPTVCVVLLLPCLLWLGRWQLERAAEKGALRAAFEANASQPAVPYWDDPVPPFTHVRAKGRWDARQFLLDAQVRSGRVGYRVWTPLALADGSFLIVDRGWVAAGADRRALPAVALPQPVDQEVEVEGLTDGFPGAGVRAGAAPPSTEWPRVALYPTHGEIVRALGAEVRPVMLRVAPGSAASAGLEADADLASMIAGRIGFPPERHLGYAVTWFALAATLVLLWLLHAARERDAEGR